MTEAPAAPFSETRGFLFADLRGYTAYAEARGDQAAANLLSTYRAHVRDVIPRFEGAEIRTEGDSFYVVFRSASTAIRAGLEILERTAGSPGERIRVAIGIHAGEATQTAEGYVGSAVNVAARICALAGPGELLVSETVRSIARGQLDVRFVPRGSRRLKGIAEPVAVYAVAAGVAPLPRRWSVTNVATSTRRRLGRLALPAALAVGVLVLTAGALALIDPSFWGRAQERGTPAPAAAVPSVASQASATDGDAESESLEGDVREAAEQRLRERIDPAIARHCVTAGPGDAPDVVPRIGRRIGAVPRSDRAPANSDAGVRCSLGGSAAPDEAQYWQLRTLQQVDDAFSLMAGDRSLPPGDCAVDTRASGRWSFGTNSGRLLCTAFGGEALVAWTYDGETLLALATRGDGDVRRILDWWEATARLLRP